VGGSGNHISVHEWIQSFLQNSEGMS
jgi:hypothetical protein